METLGELNDPSLTASYWHLIETWQELDELITPAMRHLTEGRHRWANLSLKLDVSLRTPKGFKIGVANAPSGDPIVYEQWTTSAGLHVPRQEVQLPADQMMLMDEFAVRVGPDQQHEGDPPFTLTATEGDQSYRLRLLRIGHATTSIQIDPVYLAAVTTT